MPVYNAEKYLQEAIESILNQDLSNWELIAINDGSTDKSGIIIDSYSQNDPRIRVIHQSNHGVSYTRQVAVDLAKGEYITHIDSDDVVLPTYLSSMYSLAIKENADMVWCDLSLDKEGHKAWRMTCEESTEVMIKKILLQQMWGSLCNKLIRREICQNKDVKFPVDCKMWEDMAYLIQCLISCKNIKYLPKPFYYYRQNEDSLTHQNLTRVMCYEYEKAVNKIDSSMKNSGLIDKYSIELNSLKLFVIRDYIDDLRIRSFEKFLNTYPEAIDHINEYPNYPTRIKICCWLLQHNLSLLVPLFWRMSLL